MTLIHFIPCSCLNQGREINNLCLISVDKIHIFVARFNIKVLSVAVAFEFENRQKACSSISKSV